MVIKNVEVATFPLLIVLCLFGFEIFEYPQGQPRILFSIFYILISWSLHVYFIIKAKIFCRTVKLFKYDLPLQVIANVTIGMLNVLLTLCYDQKFKGCLNRLSIVNETLEKLGTPKNYMKLRKRVIWLIIEWIILTLFLNIIDILWFSIRVPRSSIVIAICLALIINYSYHINVIYDFKYMILFGYIKTQFKHVNQHIQKLTKLKKHTWATSTLSIMNDHMAGTEISKQSIWILMHVYHELCSISYELTRIFGLQMILQTIVIQLYTIQLIFEFYEFNVVTQISDNTYKLTINFLNTYAWSTVIIAKMIIFNYICEGLCTQANRTELFLNSLTNLSIFDVETQENIMQFLLQILQRPLRISALGFFYFGYKFIYKCVNYIGSIIIFMLQSYIPEETTIK